MIDLALCHDSSWNTSYDRPRRDVLKHDCPCPNHSALANGDAWIDDYAREDANVAPDGYLAELMDDMLFLSVLERVVIPRRKDARPWPDTHMVVYLDLTCAVHNDVLGDPAAAPEAEPPSPIAPRVSSTVDKVPVLNAQ